MGGLRRCSLEEPLRREGEGVDKEGVQGTPRLVDVGQPICSRPSQNDFQMFPYFFQQQWLMGIFEG